ncbi:MAG: hypothetical protein LBT59_05220 [Clostridiales bacterium]|nr:hypothetical protein [Clostridiales bacterium]
MKIAKLIACEEYLALKPPQFYVENYGTLAYAFNENEVLSTSTRFIVLTEQMLINPYDLTAPEAKKVKVKHRKDEDGKIRWFGENSKDVGMIRRYVIEPGKGYIVAETLDLKFKSCFEFFEFSAVESSGQFEVCVQEVTGEKTKESLTRRLRESLDLLEDIFWHNFSTKAMKQDWNIEAYMERTLGLPLMRLGPGEKKLKIEGNGDRIGLETSKGEEQLMPIREGLEGLMRGEPGDLFQWIAEDIYGGFEILEVDRFAVDIRCNVSTVMKVKYVFPRDRALIAELYPKLSAKRAGFCDESKEIKSVETGKLGDQVMAMDIRDQKANKNKCAFDTPFFRDLTQPYNDGFIYALAEDDDGLYILKYKEKGTLKCEGKSYRKLKLASKNLFEPGGDKHLLAMAQVALATGKKPGRMGESC